MCTHQRFVINRYTQNSFLTKCGKCPACLQEKAYKRASRIKSEYNSDLICLTATLTYDRASCPFVYKQDIQKRNDILNVYREYYTRRVPVSTRSGVKYLDKRYFERQILNTIYYPNYDSFDYLQSAKCKKVATLRYRDDHVGICYYPDVQLFKKRLNINLKRKYGYDYKYKVYSCSEYGESSQRPHFHVLFFIRPQDEALFRAAVCEAWPFADKRRTAKYIELARDMANYLASYVNSNTFVHGFLSDNFKTKHSYSKDFGMSDKLFSLDSVLSKVRQRDLSYLRPIGPKGLETYVNLPIPQYVINRHFPKFKGYSRLSDVEVLDVLRSFTRPITERPSTPLINLDKLLRLDYTKDDLHKIQVRLYHSYEKYHVQTGRNMEDYFYDFRDTWRVYDKTIKKLWYEEGESPRYMYDNINQLYGGIVDSPYELERILKDDSIPIDDPNQFPKNVERTRLYEQTFAFRSKERKINNFVASRTKYFV